VPASSPVGPQPRLEDATVTASDRQLNVGAGGSVTLLTVLPVPAREKINIRDLTGNNVRTLVDESRPAGTFSDIWDGKGENGRRLKDGQYRWVTMFGSGTTEFTIDPSTELDGDFEVKSHPDYKPWNPFENAPLRFSHTFDRAGEILVVFSRATFRVFPKCDPPEFFCRQIEGFQPAGEFTFEWAGIDHAGALRPDIHAIFVISNHENLSRNAIVVYGGRPTVSGVAVLPPDFHPDTETQEVAFSLGTYQGERVSATVTFTNQESRSVLRTLTVRDAAPGIVKATWDGRADNGKRVAPGVYIVTVWVTDWIGQGARGEILTRVVY
jgi:flagellar hook assembly protein FlgD